MKKLLLKAPAKVNYRLDVLGKRADGYHDLRMVMQRVDLCDEIEIALTETPGIRVKCGSKGVPDGPGNIAWRAADALVKLSGKQVGIDIGIEKKIPVAAVFHLQEERFGGRDRRQAHRARSGAVVVGRAGEPRDTRLHRVGVPKFKVDKQGVRHYNPAFIWQRSRGLRASFQRSRARHLREVSAA